MTGVNAPVLKMMSVPCRLSTAGLHGLLSAAFSFGEVRGGGGGVLLFLLFQGPVNPS